VTGISFFSVGQRKKHRGVVRLTHGVSVENHQQAPRNHEWRLKSQRGNLDAEIRLPSGS
jgi:hypothetical protein